MVAPPDGTVLGFGLAGGAELLPNGAPALASTVVVLTSAAELLRYDVGALGRAPSAAPHGREMATAKAHRPLVCVSLAAAGGGGRRPLRVLLAVVTPHARRLQPEFSVNLMSKQTPMAHRSRSPTSTRTGKAVPTHDGQSIADGRCALPPLDHTRRRISN